MQSAGSVSSALFQKWAHSFEEDARDVQVYRPETYPFPRARGRAGMQFYPDGTFTEWRIGRGDAPSANSGTWRLEGANEIRVTLPAGSGNASSFTLVIMECTPEILKVKRK